MLHHLHVALTWIFMHIWMSGFHDPCRKKITIEKKKKGERESVRLGKREWALEQNLRVKMSICRVAKGLAMKMR